jgi:hypothetical protein
MEDARMSWKRLATTVSTAALVALAGTASAKDDEFGRSGPYIAAGAAYAFELFDDNAGDPAPDDSWGYHLAGGFRFNEWFALEVTWEHFPTFEGNGGDVDIWMIGANGKFYPLHGFIQPYILAGAGWSQADDERAASKDSAQGIAARFAGGLEVYATRNIGAFVETGYFLPTGDGADYDFLPISFGVFYRFF